MAETSPTLFDELELIWTLKEGGFLRSEVVRDGEFDNDKVQLVYGPGRPRVELAGGELPYQADVAEWVLQHTETPLYQRSGALVRIIRTEQTGRDKFHVKRRAGSAQIEPVTAPWLQDRLTKAVLWLKYNMRTGEYDTPADCTIKMANVILHRKGHWHCPVLTGISEVPCMRPDGSIVSEPGFDEATGIFLDVGNGMELPEIPKEPTREDALAALEVLKVPLEEFPFCDDESRAVALAAVLTPLVRPCLPSAPLIAFSAPQARTGKSRLVDIASIVATGKPVAVMALGPKEEETEKRLDSSMLRGDPLLSIDNIEQPLQSAKLCVMLTAEQVQARILGKSKQPELPALCTVYATGNALQVRGDLQGRTIQCDIDARMERPEERTFKRDCIAYARAHRAELVAAGLVLLRAHCIAGFPGEKEIKHKPMGGFEVWSKWVRAALCWVGEADVKVTQDRVRESDPMEAGFRALVTRWHELIGEKPLTARAIIDRALDGNRYGLKEASELQEILGTVLEKDITDRGAVIALGKWLGKRRGRRVGDFQLAAESKSDGTNRWYVRKLG